MVVFAKIICLTKISMYIDHSMYRSHLMCQKYKRVKERFHL